MPPPPPSHLPRPVGDNQPMLLHGTSPAEDPTLEGTLLLEGINVGEEVPLSPPLMNIFYWVYQSKATGFLDFYFQVQNLEMPEPPPFTNVIDYPFTVQWYYNPAVEIIGANYRSDSFGTISPTAFTNRGGGIFSFAMPTIPSPGTTKMFFIRTNAVSFAANQAIVYNYLHNTDAQNPGWLSNLNLPAPTA